MKAILVEDELFEVCDKANWIYGSNDYKTVYTLEENEVYVYSRKGDYFKKGEKIGESDYSAIMYFTKVTKEGLFFMSERGGALKYYDGKDCIEIFKSGSWPFYCDDDVVYYKDENNTLYKQIIGGEKVKIADDVYSVVVDNFGKHCYYISDVDETKNTGKLFKEGVKDPIDENVESIASVYGNTYKLAVD